MEPAFTVKGDSAITKDIKVNVEMIKEDGTTIATAYYNGESYNINNEGTLYYTLYISYKNSFYYVSATDNLHGKIKGEPINEIVISKKDDAVLALYRPLMTSRATDGVALQPEASFFKDISTEEAATTKRKFTTLYK